ncbi:MAG TPA: YHS domain-containing (seleno)protein [Cyclobacteriaceae bacterium]|nr:YHS domain-containing (seleno)protein [Cyclobacteriaceae bacterium]
MKRFAAYFILIALIAVACGGKKSAVEVFVTPEGAINGYDPVSYFKVNMAVKGDGHYSYEWKDATWHFVSEENLSLFKADPEKYAPQFGGYCAYGMSQGHKAPTEPDAWTIVEDKLYFNYNKDVQKKWQENRDELIKQAETNWPKIRMDPF